MCRCLHKALGAAILGLIPNSLPLQLRDGDEHHSHESRMQRWWFLKFEDHAHGNEDCCGPVLCVGVKQMDRSPHSLAASYEIHRLRSTELWPAIKFFIYIPVVRCILHL